MSEQFDGAITINGVEYVRKDSVHAGCTLAPTEDGLPYKMVRTYSAGVFAGYVEKLDNGHAVLRNARRIWHWEGAASLSQLAMEGTSNPNGCTFPREVERIELFGVIEVIDITEKAKKSIDEVPVWKK